MVREDLVNWLKTAIANGENANDAAIRLIVAGHDMYEVRDALRMITSEISDKQFSFDEVKKPEGNSPSPSKEIPNLPKLDINKGEKGKGFFSRKKIKTMIWIVLGLMIATLAYLLYLLTL